MVTIKTAELIGPALDYAVGIATGEQMFASASLGGPCARRLGADGDTRAYYSPSTSWSEAGPLIHRYRIAFEDNLDGFFACIVGGTADGDTHLIAACRAIVAAHLGEEVQVPAELVQGGAA